MRNADDMGLPPIQRMPSAFDNGLTPDQDDAINNAMIAISRLVVEIDAMGRHRSYSLAVTKLEEAKHWLRDRKHKPA